LIEKSFKWQLSNSGKPKSIYRYGNPEPSPEKYLTGKVQRLDGSYPNVKPRVKGESNSQNL